LAAREPRRPVAFSSVERSFIAARSSAVNPSYDLALVRLVVFFVSFMAGLLPYEFDWGRPHASEPAAAAASPNLLSRDRVTDFIVDESLTGRVATLEGGQPRSLLDGS
jgi:hypothetical protein